MPTSPLRRLVLFALIGCGVVAATIVGSALPAAAHNTLLSSDPADGATLEVAPTEITWTFDNSVPLETMTVTAIDASGVRTELSGSTHGAAGDTQVLTPLPQLQDGEVSMRWRLVGPDGHPITGRVDFTITADQTATTPEQTTTSPPPATPSTAIPSPDAQTVGDDLGEFSTPAAVRWILRYTSYLAIMAVVGILLTSAAVWGEAGTDPTLRRLLSYALLATALLGLAQLLVIASDIAAAPPWSAISAVDAATSTDAGLAFAARIVLALTMWFLLFRDDLVHPEDYWSVVSLAGLGLLGTWAFAGHSSSMRWSTLGILADIAHHGAAAAWIGGLAIVGWIVIPTADPAVVVPVVRRFSSVAAASVAILVATGIVQSMRLVGNPIDLLTVDHGRYLAVKLAILAGMLAIANANRRRVERHLDDPDSLAHHIHPLRKAMLSELAIGLIIVAVTAAMVVAPPATSETAGAIGTTRSPLYYIV